MTDALGVIAMNAVQEAETKCTECGEQLTSEEIKHPSDYGSGTVCVDCEFRNHHWLCDICGNYEEEDYAVEAFAVYEEEEAGIPVGVYVVLRRPFYIQGMIGGGRIYEDCVMATSSYPPDRQGDHCPCSMLCSDCAKPYLGPGKTISTESTEGAQDATH